MKKSIEMSEEVVFHNLEALSKLKENEKFKYEGSKLFVDDNYAQFATRWMYGYTLLDTLNILQITYEWIDQQPDKSKYKDVIKTSLVGLQTFKKTYESKLTEDAIKVFTDIEKWETFLPDLEKETLTRTVEESWINLGDDVDPKPPTQKTVPYELKEVQPVTIIQQKEPLKDSKDVEIDMSPRKRTLPEVPSKIQLKDGEKKKPLPKTPHDNYPLATSLETFLEEKTEDIEKFLDKHSQNVGLWGKSMWNHLFPQDQEKTEEPNDENKK